MHTHTRGAWWWCFSRWGQTVRRSYRWLPGSAPEQPLSLLRLREQPCPQGSQEGAGKSTPGPGRRKASPHLLGSRPICSANLTGRKLPHD